MTFAQPAREKNKIRIVNFILCECSKSLSPRRLSLVFGFWSLDKTIGILIQLGVIK